MSNAVTSLKERAKHPETVKVARYSAVSVISVGVTTITQFVSLLILGGHPVISTLIAAVCGAIPSYYLNRAWVWGKSGRSHMRKEVIPFWIMAAVGFFVASGASAAAHRITEGMSPTLQSVITTTALVFAYGGLWLGKFILFNRVLFVKHPEDLDPVLDGRSGIPT